MIDGGSTKVSAGPECDGVGSSTCDGADNFTDGGPNCTLLEVSAALRRVRGPRIMLLVSMLQVLPLAGTGEAVASAGDSGASVKSD